MIRNIAGKLAWVGRTTSMVFGLAFVMALVFGVATTALSATGGNFILGKGNTASKASKLTANVAGPALALVNNSTVAAATALNLTVPAGKAPLTVNATAGTATNLSADKLDGQDSSAYQNRVSGVCPVGQSIREIGADGASVVCEADNGEGTAPDSELLDGKDSSEFAAASHPHAGEDIASGTVSEARVDPSVTRDSEVMDTVKAADGAGSTLDADTVDGKSSEQLKGARAYGVVVPSEGYTPFYVADASSGITNVRSIGTGHYCVRVANQLLDDKDLTAVVSVNPGHTHGDASLATAVTAEGSCSPSEVRVVTERLRFDFNRIATDPDEYIGFNVVIP